MRFEKIVPQVAKEVRKWPQNEQKPLPGNYIEDDSAILGNGKYKEKTLGWLKINDSNYYDWLKREDLIQKWGLVQGFQKPKKRTAGIRLQDGIYYYKNTEVATDDNGDLVYDNLNRLYLGLIYDDTKPYKHLESPFL